GWFMRNPPVPHRRATGSSRVRQRSARRDRRGRRPVRPGLGRTPARSASGRGDSASGSGVRRGVRPGMWGLRGERVRPPATGVKAGRAYGGDRRGGAGRPVTGTRVLPTAGGGPYRTRAVI